MKFTHTNAPITKKQLETDLKKLDDERQNMKEALKNRYEDDRASLFLPQDKDMLDEVQGMVKEMKKLKPDYLVVVGIGGSNLGTIAVQEAILGKRYNALTEGTKILYVDTTDSRMVQDTLSILEPVLKEGGKVVVNGVSKSGTTTETIANFEILVNLLRKHKTDFHRYVVVTTDKGSKLYNLALDKDFRILEIPKKVGGRYSVFSPVGLFPLGMLDIDIVKLLQGAKKMRDDCLKKRSPASINASIIHRYYKKDRNICDLFLFVKDLESIGKWYRQLMGESIGKERNRQGRKVNVGITPTVSIGSTDLHSMAQLYLGGPYDKTTHFIHVKKQPKVRVPKMKGFDLVEDINGRPLGEVMDAILEGVKIAFKKDNRPFTETELEDINEEEIGALLQFKMMEMMFLGTLLNVNPFNQPNVEAYKKETRRILGE